MTLFVCSLEAAGMPVSEGLWYASPFYVHPCFFWRPSHTESRYTLQRRVSMCVHVYVLCFV